MYMYVNLSPPVTCGGLCSALHGRQFSLQSIVGNKNHLTHKYIQCTVRLTSYFVIIIFITITINITSIIDMNDNLIRMYGTGDILFLIYYDCHYYNHHHYKDYLNC